MREIRSSGLEGGVEFNPPSLPLFYSKQHATPPFCLSAARSYPDGASYPDRATVEHFQVTTSRR